tara:strand:+ start:282 stop:659 length:378 start_codon:yes stop_codon:yes gene_type:complete
MNSKKWNLSENKCVEIIQMTLIDILTEKPDKILPLNKLIKLLNSRTKIYKLSNDKKYNSFSKYLKSEYNGILNFIECYNFYEIIKTDKNIFIKLYKNLVDLNDLESCKKRITRDNEWILIKEDDY